MLDFFRNLFAYDEWATRCSLSSIDEAKKSEAAWLLAHVLYSEKIWLMRLKGEDSTGVSPFGELSFDECARLTAKLGRDYLEYLNALAETDLDAVISYMNTQGINYQNSVRDILTHVGLHGVYHRAQIARIVRESGGTAVNTDFITFARL